MRWPTVCYKNLWDEWAQTHIDVVAEANAHGEAGSTNADRERESPPIVNISEDAMELDIKDEDSPALQASTPDDPRSGGYGSDPPDGSDDSDAEQNALQQFASALQKAQEITVQMEKDQASQKKNTQRTYRGSSR